MKKFQSATSDIVLGVYQTAENRLGLKIGRFNIHLAPSDIPALMLALGELHNTESPYMFEVMSCLTTEVQLVAEAEAEAKEQAELEAEALELYNVCMTGHNLTSFDGLGGALRDQWLAVARKAREMRAEK